VTQQEVEEDVIATLTFKKVCETYLSSKNKSLRLPSYDPSLEPS